MPRSQKSLLSKYYKEVTLANSKYLDFIFLKWLVVGSICFFIDYFLFLILYNLPTLGKFVTLCNGISMGFATFLNYFLHKTWTFQSDKSRMSTIRNYIINFGLIWSFSTLGLKALLTIGMAPSFAKFFMALSSVPISYLTLRFYVFGSNNKRKTLT